jgi:HD superfamily phosphohydrolase
LNKVKQSWQNATHTRYEHSMGVVVKCLIFCDYLNSKLEINDSKRLTEKDISELVLASALHDCGHLPISHAIERAFLSCSEKKVDVTHEARIIPLILGNHPYFEEIRKIAGNWKKGLKKGTSDVKLFDNDSLIRVALIISGGKNELLKSHDIPVGFNYPKTAIIQLLSSEIDLDRLDYIFRDSEKLNYRPVRILESSILYLAKGLSLAEKNELVMLDRKDVELCIDSEYLPNMFYYLVSRVLLYKFCYFLPSIRGFEAVSTNIVNELLINNVLVNQYQLMVISDDEFIGKANINDSGLLYELSSTITDKKTRDRLIKSINVIKEEKASRYNIFGDNSVYPRKINNPRLKEDLINNLNKHSYINKLKEHLIEKTRNDDNPLRRDELQFDVFDMKAGNGNILVSENGENGEKSYNLLNDYMNGSNIYRLCTETRLDIYYKSDLSEQRKNRIIALINPLFS